MGYKNYDELEITVSIKDMIMRICLKWRQMLAWGIVLAVLFNCVGILKSYNAVQASKNSNVLTWEEQIDKKIESAQSKTEDAKGSLSQRECEEVERAVDSYESLKDKYNKEILYSNESIYMQLDPSNIPVVTLNYTVDNHYQVEYPLIDARDNIGAILESFCSGIESDKICEQIAESLGKDVQASYIKEIINTDNKACNFSVEAMGLSDKDCEVMGKILKEEIQNIDSELKKVYGDFDLTLVSETYGTKSSADVMNDQTTQMVNMNNMKNAFNNLSNYMSDDQKTYYNALLDSKNLEDNRLELLKEEVKDEQDVAAPSVKMIHKKYMVLGFLLGIFLVALCVGMRYLLTGKLRTSADISECFGVTVIGKVKKNEKKPKIDAWIKSIFYGEDGFSYEEHIRMVCAGVRIAAQKHGYEKVYITSASNNDVIKKCMSEIGDGLKEQKVCVESGPSIIYDPESLEKMASSDAVVFIEEIDGSRYQDIKTELEKAHMNQNAILGCVVLE